MRKKFDIIIGNPPYNLRAGDGGPRGTKGDNAYYKKIIKMTDNLVKPGGVLCFVTPRGLDVLNSLKNLKLTYINHMFNFTGWKYSTCFFICKNTNEDVAVENVINSTVEKAWGPGEHKLGIFGMTKSDLAKEWVDAGTPGSIEVLGYVTGDDRGKTFNCFDTKKVVKGPKFVCSQLDSTPSYTATDRPVLTANAHYIKTETLEEAEKLKLFLENNKFMKYLKNGLKLKATHIGLKYIKKFDLNQIETGYEYPKEFDFTAEDIKVIEDET